MSDLISKETSCQLLAGTGCTAISLVLEPTDRDLGGFSVRRLLPTRELPSVGPFIFFDHLGPAEFASGTGIDVRPHPHIGLATITYVFEGEILHRDNLGSVQAIRPQEINWMTAGKGIVHSERTGPELRRQGHTLEALQLWVALPEADEETAPFFSHYDSSSLPLIAGNGITTRIMIGEAYGVKSAVKTHSPTLYVEARLEVGATITVPDGVEERAVYLVSGSLTTGETLLPQHTMTVFDSSPGIELTARESSRLVIIGGRPLGKRTVWWNLAASRKELIEQAKDDWQNGRFPKIPGETEFIPLPDA
jgi:redox-sensitive bicupin YhaK (pirin superfamily)